MFSYIRRLRVIFVGFKILNFNIFWAFRKMNIFWGMKTLWIFLGHHKIALYLGVISIHFRVSSLGQGTEWGIIFWVAKISNSFFVYLKFRIFFGVNGRCWARVYV